MKPNERLDKLVARLKQSRHAEQTDSIVQIVRGQAPLIHGMAVEVEQRGTKAAPNGADYHVRIAASTEGIARDSGIIPITAWERGGLRNFAKNPIILAFHSHKDPIGRSNHTEISGDQLVQYWEFHGETEMSRNMKALYERGFMRAASVGFLVHDYAFVDELDGAELTALENKYGKSAVKDIYWIARDAELLETSAVPVPSDPNALAFSFAARNANAVGMDMTDMLSRWGRPTDRSTEMKTQNQTPNPEAREATSTGTPAEGTENREGTASEQPDPLAEIRTLIDSLGTTLRAEVKVGMDALNGRLAAIEQARSGSAGTSNSAGAGEEGGTEETREVVEIEVRDGETEEQAAARFVDEMIAAKRGAPSPTKK